MELAWNGIGNVDVYIGSGEPGEEAGECVKTELKDVLQKKLSYNA